MKPDATRLRRTMPWVGATALVIAAWGVGIATPPDYAAEPASIVQATIGERAAGRDIVATVTDVRAAQMITSGDWGAQGNWLVVDVEAETVLTVSMLRGATLTVGDLTFRASERMDSFFEARLAAGIPRSGSLAFELPNTLRSGGTLTGEGILSLSLDSDARGDSVIQLTIDLDEIPLVAKAELLPTGWTQP